MNLDKTGTGGKRVSGLAVQGTRWRAVMLATVHEIFALALSRVQEFVFRDIQGIRKDVQYGDTSANEDNSFRNHIR